MKTRTLLPLVILVSACAHYPDVRPGSEGVHSVKVRGGEEKDAEREAMRQARSYCNEFKKQPAFVSENTKYTGDMDEVTHKTVRKVSKVATVLGSTTSVFGGQNESKAGTVAAGAGVGGGMMTDDAYTTEMKFKCQ